MSRTAFSINGHDAHAYPVAYPRQGQGVDKLLTRLLERCRAFKLLCLSRTLSVVCYHPA